MSNSLTKYQAREMLVGAVTQARVGIPPLVARVAEACSGVSYDF